MSRSSARSLPWPIVVVAAVVLVASLTQTEFWSTQVATEPLPTGTFSEGGPIGNCPANHDCTSFTVSGCTNVSKAQDGVIAHAKAIGPTRGMAVIFSGGGGTIFWSTDNVPADTLIEDVRQAGLDVVQVRWTRAWTLAEPGEDDAGAAHVACRPATAVKWIHDNLYAGLGVPSHGVGDCGFCVTGTSGGSSQAAYTVSHYGLENIVDAVIPVSGPTHAAMAKGCLRRPGEEDYWYSGASTRNIDYTYGFTGTDGPCRSNAEPPYVKAEWQQLWDRESVDTQGSDYNHPQTRVHLIIGGDDRAMQAHGGDYFNRLNAQGSPRIRMQIVSGMPHAVTQSTAGMEALTAALLGDNPPPPPTPTLSINDVSVDEGDTGPTTATFTVSLSARSDTTVGVTYATANGSATVADNDYAATTGSLSFAAGETTKTVAVVVNGDTKEELDETFTVGLTNPTNATLADSTGVGTILDDDTATPVSAVTNGGFESGLTGWSAMSASAVSTPKRTGTGAARLGGSVSASTGLTQAVTVPTGGQLELWVHIDGADTTTADTFMVQIGGGRNFTTVATVTSAAAHGSWTQVKVDLSAYAGQSTTLRLLSFNDATNPTTFYVDDVSLVAGSGQEPPPPPTTTTTTTTSTSTSTTTSTSSTTNPPPPPPPGSVVTNGDFSSDLSGWTTYATWVATPARSAPGAARMGGSNAASGGMVQTVTVPANGQLEAWVWVEGTESTGADKLQLQVGSGRNYQTFPAATVTSAFTRSTWHRVTADLSAYEGQSTNLRFLWTNDTAAPTTFYLDDVSLVAG